MQRGKKTTENGASRRKIGSLRLWLSNEKLLAQDDLRQARRALKEGPYLFREQEAANSTGRLYILNRLDAILAGEVEIPEPDLPAVPEPKTVMLHALHIRDTAFSFRRITAISKYGNGSIVRGDTDFSNDVQNNVAESPARITELARDAWSTEEKPWSCPGAEPPVVVLLRGYMPGRTVLSKITRMERWGDLTKVWGTWQDGYGQWATTWQAGDCYSMATSMSEEDIIAACAEEGVPCCAKRSLSERVAERIDEQAAEERPELLVGVDLASGAPVSVSVTHGADGTVWTVDPQVEKLKERVAELEKQQEERDVNIKNLEIVRNVLRGNADAVKTQRDGLRQRVEEVEGLAGEYLVQHDLARVHIAEVEAKAQKREAHINDLHAKMCAQTEREARDWLEMRNERDKALRNGRGWQERWGDAEVNCINLRQQIEDLNKEKQDAEAEAIAMRAERDALNEKLAAAECQLRIQNRVTAHLAHLESLRGAQGESEN